MTAWKARVESWFGKLGMGLYRHPLKGLAVLLLLIGVTATQLRHIYFDTSTEGFLSPSHPMRFRN